MGVLEGLFVVRLNPRVFSTLILLLLLGCELPWATVTVDETEDVGRATVLLGTGIVGISVARD